MTESNIEALRPMYQAVMGQISSIDEQLDAASGGKSAGRRAIINGIVRDNEETVDSLFNQIMTQAFGDSVPDELKVALYFGLQKKLADNLEDKLNAVVEPLVQKVPEAPAVSDEDVLALQASRSDAYKQAKYVRDLLGMFGADVEGEFPAPKRRGGGGKRGERAISKFSWTLDGERMPAADDSLTAISKKLGFEKAVLLRNLMKEAGINLTTPTDPIEFFLDAEKSPDNTNHNIVGNKRAEDEVDDDEEDDEDE